MVRRIDVFTPMVTQEMKDASAGAAIDRFRLGRITLSSRR